MNAVVTTPSFGARVRAALKRAIQIWAATPNPYFGYTSWRDAKYLRQGGQ